jgi:diapolycopene oxygenase
MTDRPKAEVLIIGGGLGGLASACTLAARGYAVTLIERNDWVGGKAALLEDRGFRFDMGPTILTLPAVLERIFREAGRNLKDALNLVRLDPQWRCFFEDQSVLDLHENTDAMAGVLDDYAPNTRSGERYRKFLDFSHRLHNVSDRFFFWRPIGSISDMFSMGGSMNLSTLRDVMALRMGRSVASTIRSMTPDPRVSQMLDHFTQYVGSAPDQSPAVLCGVAHMQTHDGIWYPMGGTRAGPMRLWRNWPRQLGRSSSMLRSRPSRRILDAGRAGGWRNGNQRRASGSSAMPWFPTWTRCAPLKRIARTEKAAAIGSSRRCTSA